MLLLLLPLAMPAQGRGATQSLDTVRVISRATASVAGATRSVEVLTRVELARFAGRSLADVLGRALGVDAQTRSPAQADLSLRGSTFNQVVILVDGVRVSDVQSGHYALDLAVPMAMIERVEILRGGGSALYGSDAIGGVVNIVTRTDGDARELSARGGSFGGASASAIAQSNRAGWRLALGGDGDRSGGHRDGTDYDITQVRASAERGMAGGRARMDMGQGLRRFGAANFYSPFPSEETTRSTTAALHLETDAAQRVTLSGGLHTRRHSDVFTLVRTNPARYQNSHLSWETGGEVNARTALSSFVTLATGAELLDARLRSARLGDHAQQRRAAYGELTVGSAQRAALDLGLRGDHVQGAGSFLSPSLGIAIPIAPHAQLRGSVSRGFRAPTWTERYYRDPANIADSTLGVERFWSSEVGLRTAPAGRAVLDVALFERRASDLIDWARPLGSAATVPWRTMSFATARYRGVESSLRVPDLGGIDWTLRLSGLRFQAQAADGLVGKYALRPLTRTVGLAASHAVGERGLVTIDGLHGRHAGESDHTQLGARLDVPLATLHATLELVNVTNSRFLDASGKPVAGRSAFVGLRWEGRR